MRVDFTKDECELISAGMAEGVKQAEAEIAAFKPDAKQQEVTATLVARSLMQMIKDKVDAALAA